MSGRIVAPTYRHIIDDVVTNCRADFDELGIEQAVLDALQASWESKLLTARVADFSQDHRLGAAQAQLGPAPPRPSDHEISSSSKDKKPKSEVPAANGSTATPVASASTSADTSLDSATKPEPGAVTAPGSTTGTAAGDDEINSDLDDSEDEADAQEVADMEAGGGDLVIALYDKVQRVKNKWKATLKDGVVSVEGKDYLFHKCGGEFEW